MRIHFDNKPGWEDCKLWWCKAEKLCRHDRLLEPAGTDDYGPFFDVSGGRTSHFIFNFQNGDDSRNDKSPAYNYYSFLGSEVWVKYDFPEVYHIRPARVKGHVMDVYENLRKLFYEETFHDWTDVSGLGIKTMLGATVLKDGTCLFTFFHPRAAAVYLCGDFNGWQHPGRDDAVPEKFIPMDLYKGVYNYPNLWLVRIPWYEGFGDEYKFFVQGGIDPLEGLLPQRLVVDPYTRAYGKSMIKNNSRVMRPQKFPWRDHEWKTPPVHELFLYELSVYGMTQGIPEIPEEKQGTFQGLSILIEKGYFKHLGVTALALMPTSEAPTFQGPNALGYDPCGFMSIERDFGTPDDFRQLVDTAHQNGLAVIVDQVFNHVSNTFNPLWGVIRGQNPGGFYFSGGTPWGNRVATEKDEVQNMLIDACKIMIHEYHVDGFRFDATHSGWVDHGFLQRLAHEIKDRGFKPDCLLICENLPNEKDLNLQGYNGFAQWCDPFHDKIKALLREGVYQDWVRNDPQVLGDIFYFCKSIYAAHTNNVINYCESHDENSVPYEVKTNPEANADRKQLTRKAKLALLATITALGQPMIYMGQEFGVDRPRNLVLFDWPDNPSKHPFYHWAQRVLSLRKKFPQFKIYGYNPIVDGKFAWVIGPWLDERHGGNYPAIGWRIGEVAENGKQMLCLFNFGPQEKAVDLPLPPGKWLKVCDLDEVNELDAEATDAPDTRTTLHIKNDPFYNYNLPPFSGFVYYHPAGN